MGWEGTDSSLPVLPLYWYLSYRLINRPRQLNDRAALGPEDHKEIPHTCPELQEWDDQGLGSTSRGCPGGSHISAKMKRIGKN